MTKEVILTKHELRKELLKLDLILELYSNNEKIFVVKEPSCVCAIIDNKTSTYELTKHVQDEFTDDEIAILNNLLDNFCQTSPLVRDIEKEFVLREKSLPCFPFEGGYEFLGTSPFNPKKYTHVTKEKAKVFTHAELKDILHYVDYQDLVNHYEIVFV